MEERYHTAGWKKFELNRRRMLAHYDLAKFENEDRPLQTEHGVIAESSLRHWLKECLPEKYGVTSGFIIPPIIEPDDYTEYHFDIIIYEKQNCPVLWRSHNSDLSNQGQNKAIPLRYVKCVIEVKAQFNSENSKAAREGLARLRNIGARFSSGFQTGVVFFDAKDTKRRTITPLKKLVGDTADNLFNFGCILRWNTSHEVSGFFTKVHNSVSSPSNSKKIYRDIDNYVLRKDVDYQMHPNTTPSSFSTLNISSEGCNIQHFFKSYTATFLSPVQDRFEGYNLTWSRNGFSYFMLHLIYTLSDQQSVLFGDLNEYPPGLSFDKVSSAAPSGNIYETRE